MAVKIVFAKARERAEPEANLMRPREGISMLQFLGVWMILSAIAFAVYVGVSGSSKFLWGVCLLAVFAGFVIFFNERAVEITFTAVGTIKAASKQAQNDADAITALRKDMDTNATRLTETINTANETIEHLKGLGVAVSSPGVDALAMSGRLMEYIPLKYKLQRVETIYKTLRELGVSDANAAEACAMMYDRVLSDHIKSVVANLFASNPGKEPLFDGIDKGKFNAWDKAQFEKLIKDNDLKHSPETDECLLDLEYWMQHKKLRREDKWQG